MPIAPGEYRTKGDMLRKFGYYASGLAIGFVLLGVFQKLRKEELAKRQQEALQPVAPSPLFPPLPAAEAKSAQASEPAKTGEGEPLRNPN